MKNTGKEQGHSGQREKKPRRAIRTNLDAGERVMMHTHTEEESGYLVSGHIVLTIGGMDYEMHEGDVWKIPGGVPHGARVIEDSVTLELIPRGVK